MKRKKPRLNNLTANKKGAMHASISLKKATFLLLYYMHVLYTSMCKTNFTHLDLISG